VQGVKPQKRVNMVYHSTYTIESLCGLSFIHIILWQTIILNEARKHSHTYSRPT